MHAKNAFVYKGYAGINIFGGLEAIQPFPARSMFGTQSFLSDCRAALARIKKQTRQRTTKFYVMVILIRLKGSKYLLYKEVYFIIVIVIKKHSRPHQQGMV